MAKRSEIEVKVGIFVTIGVLILGVGVMVLGSTEDMLARKRSFHSYFTNVEGMIEGAKIVVGGVRVGIVKRIDFDRDKRQVRVDMEVTTHGAEWIKGDSSAEITTQGMLGDKYITVSVGAAEGKDLDNGAEIPVKASQDLSQFISKGDQLLATMTSVAKSVDNILKTFEAGNRHEQIFAGMAQTSKNFAASSEKLKALMNDMESARIPATMKSINQIVDKVNNGNGTLAALINDPSLYDDMKSLMGGANRNRIVRNLVRQTIKKSEEAEAQEQEAQKAAGQPKGK